MELFPIPLSGELRHEFSDVVDVHCLTLGPISSLSASTTYWLPIQVFPDFTEYVPEPNGKLRWTGLRSIRFARSDFADRRSPQKVGRGLQEKCTYI